MVARNAVGLDEVRIQRTIPKELNVTVRPRPAGWTAPYVQIQNESQPQWNTLGGLGSTAGPGTDDSVLWPLETPPARSAITPKSNNYAYLGSPSRICMAVSEPLQMFDEVDQMVGRRVFTLKNRRNTQTQDEETVLCYHVGNETEVAIEEYEILVLSTSPAEAVALAVVDPSAEITVLLVFRQDSSGDVYCTPIAIGPEPRSQMSWPHTGNEGVRYPVPVSALGVGGETLVASNGQEGVRSGWTGLGIDGGDLFFSSLQASRLGDDRVLLLHMESTGAVKARVLTWDNGLTVSAPVTVASGALNLYQSVSADMGLSGGVATTVAFSTRTASGGDVVVLNCTGTPAVVGTTTVSTDYSHVGWVGSRLAVLTKACYSAGGSAVGFGGSAVDILLINPSNMGVTTTIDADVGLTNLIQQTGTIHGFADGRLFMHCSSFEPVDSQVGHTYAFDGAGIRMWVVDGDTVFLQDQIAQLDSQCSSTQAVRWGTDMVFVLGPTGETYGGPPGDEQSCFVSHFVGGVLKEGSSDVQPYRLSDEWLFVTEPEKNGIWYTSPDFVTASSREISSTYVRAVHINRNGVPDIAGEPSWLYPHWSWYSAACRIDDTKFFHIGVGQSVGDAVDILDEDTAVTFLHVFEVDESTGNLTLLYVEQDTHELMVDGPDGGTYWDIAQVGDTNRYLMLYSMSTTPTSELRLRSFDLNSDYSATIIDDQAVSDVQNGGVFTERKPYKITTLSDSTFVVTWIVDDEDESHWSSHRGVVLTAGRITMGTRLGADPSSEDNGEFGYQGVWMHKGAGVGGRFVYPVADQWPSTDRYPPTTPFDKVPFALVVMEINRSTGDLSYDYYPLRVDINTIDRDWYEANEFFAPDPDNIFNTPSERRIHQAAPDGSLYHFWDTSQVFPGANAGEVWIFGGCSPVPWILAESADGLQIAKYRLDDDDRVAWYQPDAWGQFGMPYFVSYMNGSTVMKPGLFAIVSTLDYYSRGAPQGWAAGFGSNLLRLWAADRNRGVATVHDKRINTWTYPGN